MQKKHYVVAIGIILIGYFYLVRKKKNKKIPRSKNDPSNSEGAIEKMDSIEEIYSEIDDIISVDAKINSYPKDYVDITNNESIEFLNQKSIQILTNSMANSISNKDVISVVSDVQNVTVEAKWDNATFNNKREIQEDIKLSNNKDNSISIMMNRDNHILKIEHCEDITLNSENLISNFYLKKDTKNIKKSSNVNIHESNETILKENNINPELLSKIGEKDKICLNKDHFKKITTNISITSSIVKENNIESSKSSVYNMNEKVNVCLKKDDIQKIITNINNHEPIVKNNIITKYSESSSVSKIDEKVNVCLKKDDIQKIITYINTTTPIVEENNIKSTESSSLSNIDEKVDVCIKENDIQKTITNININEFIVKENNIKSTESSLSNIDEKFDVCIKENDIQKTITNINIDEFIVKENNSKTTESSSVSNIDEKVNVCIKEDDIQKTITQINITESIVKENNINSSESNSKIIEKVLQPNIKSKTINEIPESLSNTTNIDSNTDSNLSSNITYTSTLNIDVSSNSNKDVHLDTVSDDSGQVSDFANHMTISESNSPNTSLSPKSKELSNSEDQLDDTVYVSLAKGGAHPTEQPGHFEYEFDFPSRICGRLIGKAGKNINMLKDDSGVEITIKRKPFCKDFQVICIQGAISQIDVALDMIKDRFPPLKFPEIDYSPLDMDDIENMQKMIRLPLEEGEATEVWVSSVISPNHVFVQQPHHSSFKLLQQQDKDMSECYSVAPVLMYPDACVPMLPRPIEVGTVCSAPMYNGWFRALIIAIDELTDDCEIQFLDYGGFKSINASLLRQIRSDFTALPFQATECFLSNIAPIEDEFSEDNISVMRNMVFQRSVKAEVVYKEDGVPYCNLYICLPNQNAIYLNQELVDQGAAQWIDV